MKNRIFLMMMIFLSVQGFAQEKNSFFSIDGGAALPVGNYGAANLTTGSFALPGMHVGAEGAWFFRNHFGIGGGYNYIDASAKATAKKVETDPSLDSLSVQGSAQEKNSFFSIDGGVALPVGNYGAANLTTGSFALPGMHVDAEGAWFFKNHFGIGGEIGVEYNYIDASAEATAKVKADPFLDSLTIRAEAFQVYHGAIGLYFRHEIINHLSVTAKVLGGMIWGQTPYELDKPSYFGAGPDFYEITSSKDHQYFVEPGFGFQYRFNSSVGLQLSAEYLNREMHFGFIDADGSTSVENRQINLINTSLGLVIYL